MKTREEWLQDARSYYKGRDDIILTDYQIMKGFRLDVYKGFIDYKIKGSIVEIREDGAEPYEISKEFLDELL